MSTRGAAYANLLVKLAASEAENRELRYTLGALAKVAQGFYALSDHSVVRRALELVGEPHQPLQPEVDDDTKSVQALDANERGV
jgi:hypothetical protein